MATDEEELEQEIEDELEEQREREREERRRAELEGGSRSRRRRPERAHAGLRWIALRPMEIEDLDEHGDPVTNEGGVRQVRRVLPGEIVPEVQHWDDPWRLHQNGYLMPIGDEAAMRKALGFLIDPAPPAEQVKVNRPEDRDRPPPLPPDVTLGAPNVDDVPTPAQRAQEEQRRAEQTLPPDANRGGPERLPERRDLEAEKEHEQEVRERQLPPDASPAGAEHVDAPAEVVEEGDDEPPPDPVHDRSVPRHSPRGSKRTKR
jgi:hypothetical protein